MHFSYNRLWKLLIDKGINKTILAEKVGLSRSTIAKLSKNENINTNVLERICYFLDCNIEDIVEFIRDDK